MRDLIWKSPLYMTIKENYIDLVTGKKVVIPNKRGRGTKKTPVVGVKERDSKKDCRKHGVNKGRKFYDGHGC